MKLLKILSDCRDSEVGEMIVLYGLVGCAVDNMDLNISSKGEV